MTIIEAVEAELISREIIKAAHETLHEHGYSWHNDQTAEIVINPLSECCAALLYVTNPKSYPNRLYCLSCGKECDFNGSDSQANPNDWSLS